MHAHSAGPHAAPSSRADDATIHYVTSETTDVYDAGQSASIRSLCRAFETTTEPLDAEWMTSRMHGRMWELRRRATTRRQPDWSFGLGAPFARELARVGGPGAKGLLFSLGHQAPAPRLRELCFGLAFDLPVRMPAWANALPHATLTRAAATSWEAPVQLVLLEFRRGEHQPFTLSAVINDEKGGIVSRYGLIRPFAELSQIGEPDGAFRCDGQAFAALAPDEACRRVQTAIDRSDAADPALIDLESARELRAMMLCRIAHQLE